MGPYLWRMIMKKTKKFENLYIIQCKLVSAPPHARYQDGYSGEYFLTREDTLRRIEWCKRADRKYRRAAPFQYRVKKLT